jgi:general secretion pathway protein G
MNTWKIAKRLKMIREGARSEKGFTLIEIMIVVTIIALLSAVVIVPNVMTYLKKAKVDAARIQIKGFQLPLNEYMSTNGNYPPTDEGFNALVKARLLPQLPVDPWKNPYQYRFPGENDPEEYEIWSLGADGQPGGEGFNADIKSWELDNRNAPNSNQH